MVYMATAIHTPHTSSICFNMVTDADTMLASEVMFDATSIPESSDLRRAACRLSGSSESGPDCVQGVPDAVNSCDVSLSESSHDKPDKGVSHDGSILREVEGIGSGGTTSRDVQGSGSVETGC